MKIEKRITELRGAIAAGEYAPGSDLVAGEIVAKLGLVRRARRRIEATNGAPFEPEAAPPKRRFDPLPQPGRPLSEAR
jgi:hypothetical protein